VSILTKSIGKSANVEKMKIAVRQQQKKVEHLTEEGSKSLKLSLGSENIFICVDILNINKIFSD